jgi:oxygen-dependent protoporphyrinogen oxidase
MSGTVAIVGGGISGLATAYFLQEGARRSGQTVGCTLMESEQRLGGRIVTEKVEGCVIEVGPDSFLTVKPQAVDLCERLGLSDLLIERNPASSRVYILCGGKLRTLPDGLTSIVPTKLAPFLTTDLLTPQGKARMLFDVFVPPKRDGVDESLASFIRRRLGSEALERIAEPLMAGIYAGDAEQLSMQTNFPRLVELELNHRSLVTGTLAKRREAASDPSRTSGRTAFMALRGGLGVMIEALASQLKGVSILTGRKVVALRGEGPYELELEDATVLGADAVVLATPAYASAELLRESSPRVAALLDGIPYVSTATVSLAYDRSSFSHPLDGSGFVVAPSEKRRITACTWVSSKWPSHSPPDRVLLRCFLGRAGDEDVLHRGDDELCRLAQDEVKSILDVSAAPVLKRVHRCDRSLPQYVLGHIEKLAALDEGMSSLPGVFLTGAAFRGIGLPDCIKQAALAAKKAVDFVTIVEAGTSQREAPG